MVKGMKKVFYCGLNSRRASRVVGWMQVIFNFVLFVGAAGMTLKLFRLDDTEIQKLEFYFRSSSYTVFPSLSYDDIVFYTMLLATNGLLASICGFMLVKGVQEGREFLLQLWTFYVIVAWIGNCILIGYDSILMAGIFSTVFLTMYIVPFCVVDSFRKELEFCLKLQKTGVLDTFGHYKDRESVYFQEDEKKISNFYDSLEKVPLY